VQKNNCAKPKDRDGEEDKKYNRIQTGGDADGDNIVGMGIKGGDGTDGYKIFYRVILVDQTALSATKLPKLMKFLDENKCIV